MNNSTIQSNDYLKDIIKKYISSSSEALEELETRPVDLNNPPDFGSIKRNLSLKINDIKKQTITPDSLIDLTLNALMLEKVKDRQEHIDHLNENQYIKIIMTILLIITNIINFILNRFI